MNTDTENVELDFKHLIKCALKSKISWPALKIFLDSATSTLKESKKLNNILLEELELLQSKQISNLNQDETHSIIEHELLEKDVVGQNYEKEEESSLKTELVNDIGKEEETDLITNADFIEFEKGSTLSESKFSFAKIQSDDLEGRVEMDSETDPLGLFDNLENDQEEAHSIQDERNESEISELEEPNEDKMSET